MKLKTVQKLLEAKVLTESLSWEDIDVMTACGADLMSDVLAFAREKNLLLTGLIYPQVLRTSEVLDIKAIVFVRGKIPPKEVIALAIEQKMPLLATKLSMFEACGRLYKEGLGQREANTDAE
ncbi:MAG: hypothetical protein GXW85_08810 [Clostridia bacterium]|nr:hypothetical protein [Clostridia bacterium]